jgi:hypothetical protein
MDIDGIVEVCDTIEEAQDILNKGAKIGAGFYLSGDRIDNSVNSYNKFHNTDYKGIPF